jgi:NADH dehydrogenase
MFKKDIRTYTKKALESFGVDVQLGKLVSSVEPTRVTLESGEVIPAHTLVWGAGLQANPIVSSLGVELEKGNRVPVGPDLSVAGHPEVCAVGDLALITDAKTKKVLPQLGSVALQSGERAGENIARLLEGKEVEPFKYFDKGTMATIGRGAAVVQMPHGRTIKGKTATLAWGTVHLALLSTGEDRAKAMVDWTWAGFAHKRPGRITVRTDEKAR